MVMIKNHYKNKYYLCRGVQYFIKTLLKKEWKDKERKEEVENVQRIQADRQKMNDTHDLTEKLTLTFGSGTPVHVLINICVQ